MRDAMRKTLGWVGRYALWIIAAYIFDWVMNHEHITKDEQMFILAFIGFMILLDHIRGIGKKLDRIQGKMGIPPDAPE
jgi:hypothetical protein